MVYNFFKLTILRRLSQLTSSPLCATAKTPWAVCTTKGWQFTSSEAALVEYLVCPIPRLPFSFLMASSLNMLFIMPMPFTTLKDLAHFPSLVTIPADSWPLYKEFKFATTKKQKYYQKIYKIKYNMRAHCVYL